jgi:hypothetical protein
MHAELAEAIDYLIFRSRFDKLNDQKPIMRQIFSCT